MMLDKPCESYFGNVCSGFGGTTKCYTCGHDMWSHPEYQDELDELIGLLGD
jgi:hypothetical protein